MAKTIGPCQPAKQPGSFPAARAFVLQLTGDSQPAEGQLAGRIEHIASGRHGRFETIAELTQFIAEVLQGEAVDVDE